MREKIKKLKIKIKKFTDKRKGSNASLKAFCLIFLVGYIFFFSSNMFFPKVYKNIDTVNIGKIIDMDEYILTLDTWDYSKEDREFEIIFSVQNLSLNDKPDYSFTLRADEKVYITKIKKNISDNLLVLSVKNIPRNFTEGILTINVEDKSTYIGMNDKIMNKVKSIENRKDDEYIYYSKKCKIKGLKEYIKREEIKVKGYDKKINYAVSKLENLNEAKDNQTEKEREITEQNISRLASEIEKEKGKLDESMINIDEAKKRIKNIKKEL